MSTRGCFCAARWREVLGGRSGNALDFTCHDVAGSGRLSPAGAIGSPSEGVFMRLREFGWCLLRQHRYAGRPMRRRGLVLCIGICAAVMAGSVASSAAAAPKCHGFEATIVGSESNDLLFGGPTRDVIVAGPGADLIYADRGNDIICAGRGDDAVQGNPGSDRIFGNRGRDVISGGLGNDRIFGNAGVDVLFGNPGADVLAGGLGWDIGIRRKWF